MLYTMTYETLDTPLKHYFLAEFFSETFWLPEIKLCFHPWHELSKNQENQFCELLKSLQRMRSITSSLFAALIQTCHREL